MPETKSTTTNSGTRLSIAPGRLPSACIAASISCFIITPKNTKSTMLSTTPAKSPPSTTRPQLIFPIAHLGEGPPTLRHDEHRHHAAQTVGHRRHAAGHHPIRPVDQQVEVIQAALESARPYPPVAAQRAQRHLLPGVPVARARDRPGTRHPKPHHDAVTPHPRHERRELHARCPRRAVEPHADAHEPYLGKALIRVREVTPAAQLERDSGRGEVLGRRAPSSLRRERRRHPPRDPQRRDRSSPLERGGQGRVREPTVRKPGGLGARLQLRRAVAALRTLPHTP